MVVLETLYSKYIILTNLLPHFELRTLLDVLMYIHDDDIFDNCFLSSNILITYPNN